MLGVIKKRTKIFVRLINLPDSQRLIKIFSSDAAGLKCDDDDCKAARWGGREGEGRRDLKMVTGGRQLRVN